MAAELLRDQHRDAAAARFLDMITAAAKQGDPLIRDLVDVARIESGRFTINSVREPLVAVLNAATQQFTQLATNAGLTLTCDFAHAADTAVMIDYPRFAQLLSNLIENAIKFTPPGGSVRVSAVVKQGMSIISVQDTGIGISEEELPHVFERFWQANRHHRAGAGLGLAIAKGIVEAHGGQLSVDSTEGIGSTFSFTLPLAVAESSITASQRP
jgi:signal transduction histidine kinase